MRLIYSVAGVQESDSDSVLRQSPTGLKPLTTSTLAPDNRRVWALAGPIIVSNLSVPLVGIVDTAVVGHLDNSAFIGAIALGALVFSFIYWGFGFLRMGTTGLVAQALGSDDHDEIRAIAVRAAFTALAISILILCINRPILSLALHLLEASNDVEALTAEYFHIRILTAPAVLMHYVILGALVGLQNTKAALIVQLTLNLTNVVLDFVFVYGFGFDVAGVAWATVISEYLATAVGLVLVLRALQSRNGVLHWPNVFNTKRISRLAAINGNLFVRTLCVIVAHSWFTALGARFGDNTLAANAVLMLLISLVAYALDGFAHAAEALVGESWGRRSLRDFKAAVSISTRWAAGTAILFVIAYLSLGTSFIDLMTSIDAVRVTANDYLLWVAVTPIIAVWAYQCDGIFVGATHTAEMRNSMLLALLVFGIAQAVLLSRLGNHGLWLSLLLFEATRSISLMLMKPRLEKALQS